MVIEYKNFTLNTLPDNEANYFNLLASVVENVDKHSYFVITKNPHDYSFRISTSSRIIEPLIKQINIFNNSSGITVNFSKSIKSGNVFFKIQL